MKKFIDTKKESILSSKDINSPSFLKHILSIFFFILTFSMFSQEKIDETFKIISNPANENLDNYLIALNTSNFECFRFETKSRILVFKSGVTVEFFSYKQVTESGHPQVNNCYISDSVIVKEYELELVGNKIAIMAPYDQSVKRAVK